MKNCLITKLKTSIDDNNIPYLGELRLKMKPVASPTVDSAYVSIGSTKEGTIRILNDGVFYKINTTTVDETAGKEKKLLDGTTEVYVSPESVISILPRYGITSIFANGATLDISHLDYIENLKSISVSGSELTGSIDVFKGYKNLQTVHLRQSKNIVGNIESLKDSTNLKKVHFANTNVEGSLVSAFGNKTQLAVLELSETKVTGSIEGLVSAQIAAGRTSGSIQMPWAKATNTITFEGNLLSQNANISSSATTTFSWDSSGAITWSE